MTQLRIRPGPVYSRLADDLTGLHAERLQGTGYTLRSHQAETWRALVNNEAEVIFDTALTGDGKSLAGQLAMLVDDHSAMLLYPTNELIKDQEKQVERYFAAFGVRKFKQIMYSDKITEALEQQKTVGRSSIIINWLKNRDCILSNPDLFHLLGSYNYGSNQDKRELVYQVPANVDYIIFDEFHIFGIPQIVSVLNILNYQRIADPQRQLHYVFLSATPTKTFKALLSNSGFRVKEIKGEYASSYLPG